MKEEKENKKIITKKEERKEGGFVSLVKTFGKEKYVVFMVGNGAFLNVNFVVLLEICIRWGVGGALGRGIIFVGIVIVGGVNWLIGFFFFFFFFFF